MYCNFNEKQEKNDSVLKMGENVASNRPRISS